MGIFLINTHTALPSFEDWGVRFKRAKHPDTGQARKAETSQAQGPDSEFIEPLSERELEILQLIAEGLTNQKIGAKLYLSLNTVKAHTRNIYAKLGVNSRTQAVARARTLGLISSS